MRWCGLNAPIAVSETEAGVISSTLLINEWVSRAKFALNTPAVRKPRLRNRLQEGRARKSIRETVSGMCDSVFSLLEAESRYNSVEHRGRRSVLTACPPRRSVDRGGMADSPRTGQPANQLSCEERET